MKTMTLESAKNRVLAFVAAMNQWELDCAKREQLLDEGQITLEKEQELGLEAYQALLKDHWASSTPVPDSYNYGDPPAFNMDSIENVETDDAGGGVQVIVEETNRFGDKQRHRYHLVEESGDFRIESRYYEDVSGDWEKAEV